MEIVKYDEYNKIDLSKSIKRIDKEIFRVYDDYIITSEYPNKGLLNIYGKTIFEPKYSMIDQFFNGRAIVSLNKKYGIIDDKGKEIVPCLYEKIVDFKNGYYKVCGKDKCGLIDSKGNLVLKIEYSDIFMTDINEPIVYSKNNKIGIYNDNKEVALNDRFDLITGFKDGLAIIGKTDIKNNKYPKVTDSTYQKPDSEYGLKVGLIDQNGNVLIDTKYYSMSIVDSYKVIVEDNKGWHIIDYKTKKIIDLKTEYDYIKDFNNHSAVAVYCGKELLIDENGIQITKNYYDQIKDFKNGLAPVMRSVLGWGVINYEGEEVLSSYNMFGFTGITHDGNIEAMGNLDTWSLYDGKGNLLIGKQNGNRRFYDYKDGLIIHKDKETGKYTLINSNGNIIIPPFVASSVYIIDKDMIIIDNNILYIKDIKMKYYLDINYGNKIKSKIFNTKDERDKFKNKLSKDIEKFITDNIEETSKTKVKK